MRERDIVAEVLDGLREIREHRAGKKTLRATRVEANLDRSESGCSGA